MFPHFRRETPQSLLSQVHVSSWAQCAKQKITGGFLLGSGFQGPEILGKIEDSF